MEEQQKEETRAGGDKVVKAVNGKTVKVVKEDFVEKNLETFLTEVVRLRQNPETQSLPPYEIATRASEKMMLRAAVVELTCAALRKTVDRGDVSCDEARFWISALVDVSSTANGFEPKWLDKFFAYFFAKIQTVHDFPRPRDLVLPCRVARCFGTMLRTAVAVVESAQKVGKTAIKKVVGFRSVKTWSESGEWDSGDGDGFTDADRELLKSLAAQEKADRLGNQVKMVQDELARFRCERGELLKIVEARVAAGAAFEAERQRLQMEKDELRRAMASEREASRRELEDLKRQCALADNRARARSDRIADVVSPIRTQVEEAKGKPMSAEMGGVLLTHLTRILAVLKDNA